MGRDRELRRNSAQVLVYYSYKFAPNCEAWTQTGVSCHKRERIGILKPKTHRREIFNGLLENGIQKKERMN
jgi:hypothetical protein